MLWQGMILITMRIFSRHGENNPCPECIVTGVLEVNCEPAFRVSRVDV